MARTKIASNGLSERYRVADGHRFRLASVDPDDTGPFVGEAKKEAKRQLGEHVARIDRLQEKLYAQNQWALLLVFQAMDAAGKDSAIEHVLSGVNPQGCEVHSFKAPSAEELDHDFLWRCAKNLPQRGRIGVFNRSYYEEVLVVRVHPEFLGRQNLPPKLVGPSLWKERFEDIVAYERYLSRNGIVICKFFLHVSKAEQKRRFLDRLDEPAKNWKFGLADVEERQYFDQYMKCYEDMVRATATAQAPWYVVPADHKWFTRLVVADAIEQALVALKPEFPAVSPEQREALKAARARLEAEGKPKTKRGA
jgi:PPK2 family polyphosphate:nucleotide phosphotransferase